MKEFPRTKIPLPVEDEGWRCKQCGAVIARGMFVGELPDYCESCIQADYPNYRRHY